MLYLRWVIRTCKHNIMVLGIIKDRCWMVYDQPRLVQHPPVGYPAWQLCCPWACLIYYQHASYTAKLRPCLHLSACSCRPGQYYLLRPCYSLINYILVKLIYTTNGGMYGKLAGCGISGQVVSRITCYLKACS